jgi:sugar-specific transcriptional regulator TrmB
MTSTLILKKFKELGLSPNEAKSYISLLERDTLSVTEVARLARIPRTNAYEALETLLAKGFCISKPGKKKRYSALDPNQLEKKAALVLEDYYEEELAKLREKEEQILDEKKSAHKRLVELSKELLPIYKNGRSDGNPLDYIEVIKDPYQVHERFLELAAHTEKEILGFSKPPYAMGRDIRKRQAQVQVETAATKKIRNLGIHEIPTSKEEIQFKLETFLDNANENDEIRVMKELPMKMIVFDENIVMLPLEDPVSVNQTFTVQIVQHQAFAKSMRMFFYFMWEPAQDYHILEDLLKKM